MSGKWDEEFPGMSNREAFIALSERVKRLEGKLIQDVKELATLNSENRIKAAKIVEYKNEAFLFLTIIRNKSAKIDELTKQLEIQTRYAMELKQKSIVKEAADELREAEKCTWFNEDAYVWRFGGGLTDWFFNPDDSWKAKDSFDNHASDDRSKTSASKVLPILKARGQKWDQQCRKAE